MPRWLRILCMCGCVAVTAPMSAIRTPWLNCMTTLTRVRTTTRCGQPFSVHPGAFFAEQEAVDESQFVVRWSQSRVVVRCRSTNQTEQRHALSLSQFTSLVARASSPTRTVPMEGWTHPRSCPALKPVIAGLLGTWVDKAPHPGPPYGPFRQSAMPGHAYSPDDMAVGSARLQSTKMPP